MLSKPCALSEPVSPSAPFGDGTHPKDPSGPCIDSFHGLLLSYSPNKEALLGRYGIFLMP